MFNPAPLYHTSENYLYPRLEHHLDVSLIADAMALLLDVSVPVRGGPAEAVQRPHGSRRHSGCRSRGSRSRREVGRQSTAVKGNGSHRTGHCQVWASEQLSEGHWPSCS